MEEKVTCPHCGSSDVFKKNDGTYLCGNCIRRFSPAPVAKPEFVPMRLFISYGHPESEICQKIYEALKARGHDPWFDKSELKSGNDWRSKIQQGIENSQSVVACLSEHSTRDRGVCLDELAIAVGVRGGNIHSILLGDEATVKAPASVTHEQWLDMSDWRQKLAEGEAVFTPWFNNKMQQLFEVLESRDNREFCGQISTIKNRLTVYYNTSRQDKLLREPFVGREWLTEEINHWLQDDTAPRTCLLAGAPGVGKSAFAVHLSHYNPAVAAILLCSRGMNTFNDSKTVIQTLAYLLACRLPQYRRSLMFYLPETRADVQKLNEKELFELLISQPLSLSIDGCHERMVIVLDGLDECGDAGTNPLAKVLFEYSDCLPEWLRILVASRDVPSVKAYTKTAYRIEIKANTKENINDIRSYYETRLKEQFGKDPHWSEAIEKMTVRSEGVFLYAQMLSELLLSKKTLDADEDYPEGLSGIFTSWFSWFFPDVNDYASRWRPAISCMLGAPEPIPAETLRRIMNWDRNTLADFRLKLNVLLRTEKNIFGDDTILFDHAFVQEWLVRDSGTNIYYCSPEDGAEKLTDGLFAIFETAPEELSFWEAHQLTELPLKPDQKEKVLCSHTVFDTLCSAGDYCRDLEKLNMALHLYKKCLTISKTSADKFRTPEAYTELAVMYSEVSKILQLTGCISEAISFCNVAVEIFEKLDGISDVRYELAVFGYYSLSSFLQDAGALVPANFFLLKALEIFEKLADELGTPDIQKRRAYCYSDISYQLSKLSGNLSQAIIFGKKSNEILEKLADEHCTPDVHSDLVYSYTGVANLLLHNNNPNEAAVLCDKAFCICKKMAVESCTPTDQAELAFCYGEVADVLHYIGRSSEAIDAYNKALVIHKALVDESGTPEAQCDLAINYANIGKLFFDDGNPSEAFIFCEKAFRTCENLDVTSCAPTVQNKLVWFCYNPVADVLKNIGHFSEAIKVYHQALVIQKALFDELGTPNTLRELAQSYSNIGDVFLKSGSPSKALSAYNNALEINIVLADDVAVGTPKAYKDVAMNYISIAYILLRKGNPDKALVFAKKSLSITKKLAFELHDSFSQRILGSACNFISTALIMKKKYKSALTYSKMGLNVYKSAAKAALSPQDLNDLKPLIKECQHNIRILEGKLNHPNP